MANFGDTFGKKFKKNLAGNDSFEEDSDFDRTNNNDLNAVINVLNPKAKAGQTRGKGEKGPNMYLGPGAYPPLKSSISDIVDEKDKDALYRASMGRDPPG